VYPNELIAVDAVIHIVRKTSFFYLENSANTIGVSGMIHQRRRRGRRLGQALGAPPLG